MTRALDHTQSIYDTLVLIMLNDESLNAIPIEWFLSHEESTSTHTQSIYYTLVFIMLNDESLKIQFLLKGS